MTLEQSWKIARLENKNAKLEKLAKDLLYALYESGNDANIIKETWEPKFRELKIDI